MNATTAIAYLLLTVTGEGDVHHASFPTAHLCDEAKNLALYGETLEKSAAIDAEMAARRKAADAIWAAAHPCHAPKTKDELQFVADHKRGLIIFGQYDYKDGKVCEVDPKYAQGTWGPTYTPSLGEYVIERHGSFIIREKTDVKTTECLKTVPSN